MKKPTLPIIAVIILALAIVSIVNSLTIVSKDEIVLLKPENNEILTNRHPKFEWIGPASSIKLDDNPEFTSPIIEPVLGNSHKLSSKLDFTTYYWKLLGTRNSSTKQFEIQSRIEIQASQKNGSINIQNIGNTKTSIQIEQNNKITGQVVLEEKESKNFPKIKTIFTARQNE